MNRTRVASIILAGALVLGCSYQPNAKSDVFSGFPKFYKALESQAEFDFNCPDELAYSDISPGTVGVRGCGKQATYKFVDGAGWVMNAASEELSEKTP